MIYNEQELEITRRQLDALLVSFKAINSTPDQNYENSILQNALESEISTLQQDIAYYENLKSNLISINQLKDYNELRHNLAAIRIINHLSQQKIAESLCIPFKAYLQMESQSFLNVPINILKKISDIVGFNIDNISSRRLLKEQIESTKHLFPIKEMLKNGWFDNFNGTLKKAKNHSVDLLIDFFESAGTDLQFALHRKRIRAGSQLDEYALAAWQVQVLKEAHKLTLKSYFKDNSIDDEWLRNLAMLSSEKDAPLLARDYLSYAGIALVILPHLPQTFIDGAVFYNNGNPIVALTLRYDRLDHFWFVLFHELIHLSKHLCNNGIEGIIDVIDSIGDDIEKEADLLALNAMISEKDWTSTPLLHFPTNDNVCSFAQSLNISPAIVAGRIRKELNNYTILTDLLGSGTVRNLF